jgi:oligopeptidase B
MHRGSHFGAALGLALALLSQQAAGAGEPQPPPVERRPVASQHHGVTLTDDYAWLRTEKLDDVLERPEALEPPIRQHLEAENRYARAIFAPSQALERRLVAEMKARMSRRDATVPQAWGPWEYYTRYPEGSQRRLHCRRPRGGGPEQVMLDENVLARGRRGFSVSDATVSFDHKLLAYAVDEDGAERNTLYVRDLATGRNLADIVPDVRGGAVWSADSQWLFYVGRDSVNWSRKVYRHKLGTPIADDQLVYEEMAEGFSVSLRPTLSDRFMLIESGDFSTTDIKLVDLADPAAPPRPAVVRKAGEKYAVSHVGDRLILLTNKDAAIDWKIVERSLSAPADAPVEEIVPHVAGRVIEDIVVLSGHLVWLERDRERGSQQIRIRRWSDGAEHAVTFGEEPSKVEIYGGLEQDTGVLRYSYQSMAQPRQVFDYDLETRARTLRKVQDVPSGHDPGRYVTRRIEAPAPDGARVPATLLYRKDTPLDGAAPVWLYAYGAYGDTESPDFGTERLSLVDRGFISVIAHVRGGGEKGDAWHAAGRLRTKTTSFTDFIAVAEHLVRLGMTKPGRIVASGASAGGTLVAAVANMRPELFGAIYAEVPFVDVLNTLLDRTLPLTESSFSEFGNPIDSEADFHYLKAYSPYDNIRAQAYPPMFVYQTLNDSRVPYWEAAKWVAKLRERKTDRNPVVLLVNMRGGHNGGSGRFDTLEEFARAYAFALQVLER